MLVFVGFILCSYHTMLLHRPMLIPTRPGRFAKNPIISCSVSLIATCEVIRDLDETAAAKSSRLE